MAVIINFECIGDKTFLTLTETYEKSAGVTNEYLFIDLLKFPSLWEKLKKTGYARLQSINRLYDREKWAIFDGKNIKVGFGFVGKKTEKKQPFEPDISFDLKLKTTDVRCLNALAAAINPEGIKRLHWVHRYNRFPPKKQVEHSTLVDSDE